MKKLNCWEFKKCGREHNGAKVNELGVCPATAERNLDGEHNGINAGRCCWVLAGTLCKNEVQGTFAQKYKSCEVCDFYKLVKQEEFPHFVLSAVLLKKLNRI